MDKFKFLMSGLWDFLKPFIRTFMTDGGRLLLSVAKDVVLAVAMDMADSKGSEKKEAAFEMIKQRLLEEGVEMTTAAINRAIEAAHARLEEQ